MCDRSEGANVSHGHSSVASLWIRGRTADCPASVRQIYGAILDTLDDLDSVTRSRGSNLLAVLDMLEHFYRQGAVPKTEHIDELQEFARYDHKQKLTVQGQLDEALENYIEMWGSSEPPTPAEPETANA